MCTGIEIALVVAAVAGTAMQVNAQKMAGKEAKRAADARAAALDHQAKQARQIAGQEVAASQRAAFAEKKKGEAVLSRLQAVSAASGAGAGDPTVVTLGGDIGEEAEFRQMAALYGGQSKAEQLENMARLKQFEGMESVRAGAAARRNANAAAFATGVQGFAKIGMSAYSSFSTPASSLGEGTILSRSTTSSGGTFSYADRSFNSSFGGY